MEPLKKPDKIKIVIRNAENDEVINEFESTRILFIYDTLDHDVNMLPMVYRFGKEQYLIPLLNILVQYMGYNHALKAMMVDDNPWPFFTKQTDYGTRL